MAVAARQVQVHRGRDHIAAVERNTVYDPDAGVAVQVEKITVAVDLGDGNVAVHQREEVTGVAVDRQPRVCAL